MADLTREGAAELIELEWGRARQASEEGNDGMVRVCARRAAGVAIRFWLQQHPEPWGVDAMNQIRNVQRDQTIPQVVRTAAGRLLSRVTHEFGPPHREDPIEDSRTIVDHFLNVA